MAHHAYVFAGDQETGIQGARAYAKQELGIAGDHTPDLLLLRYAHFSVDDARHVIRLSDQAAVGTEKMLVLAVERIFHQAQNALLKLFEEPPPGTTLVLILPTEGLLLPTLRSRLVPLPHTAEANAGETARAFIEANAPAREKMVAKLLDRAKSDKDEEKQAARGEALRLVEGLQTAAYAAWQKKPTRDLQLFLEDLDRFIPILHERSAPLKLIFEHLLLTVPKL